MFSRKSGPTDPNSVTNRHCIVWVRHGQKQSSSVQGRYFSAGKTWADGSSSLEGEL